MTIARRDLLGLGAAVALSLTTAACRAPGDVTRSIPDPTPTPVDTDPGHLPEELPEGLMFFGASVPWHRPVRPWERSLGRTLATHRSYFTPGREEVAHLLRQCEDDAVNRRLPHVSVKAPGPWRAVADGSQDAWLSSILRPLGRSGHPVLFTLHHEPENDAGPPGHSPEDFVAMQRHTQRMAARLAPLVSVVPVLQHWTFDPMRRDAVDPSPWLIPEFPLMGLDIYNAWSGHNDKEWRSFGSKLDEVIGWFEGQRLVIGEYGCRIDVENPGRAAQWLHDAVDHARDRGVVSMSYFNSSVNADDGTWELYGETEEAFSELLASDWVARPPVRTTT
jgi:hypothetical protein